MGVWTRQSTGLRMAGMQRQSKRACARLEREVVGLSKKGPLESTFSTDWRRGARLHDRGGRQGAAAAGASVLRNPRSPRYQSTDCDRLRVVRAGRTEKGEERRRGEVHREVQRATAS